LRQRWATARGRKGSAALHNHAADYLALSDYEVDDTTEGEDGEYGDDDEDEIEDECYCDDFEDEQSDEDEEDEENDDTELSKDIFWPPTPWPRSISDELGI
jgi:hypothetical protein